MRILLKRGYRERATELTLEQLKVFIKNARDEEKRYGEPCSRGIFIDEVKGEDIYVRKDNTNYWDY